MTEPLHLSVARAFVGIRETPGPVSTAVILQWAKDIGAPPWYHDDDQAWCAVWMNRLCMAMQWPLSGTGFALLRALSFETWGRSLSEPTLGCVMVFLRPEGAHVALYLGETPTHYVVLGGNQGNAVSVTSIAKDRLAFMRWPADAPYAATGRIATTATGAASDNEA